MEISEVMIIEQLENIRKSTGDLIGKNDEILSIKDIHSGHRIRYCQLCDSADEIIKEYNWMVPKLNSFFEKTGIDCKFEEVNKVEQSWADIKEKHTFNTFNHKLTKISLMCGRALSILENLATNTREIKNKFDALKLEIQNLEKEGVSQNTLKNLIEAHESFELNRLLGTSLICGRIAIFYLDSVPGNINEKVEKITNAGLLVSKGSQDHVLKTNQKIRALFAHDINYLPSASETISIFGDTIFIVRTINEFKKKELLVPTSPPTLP